MEEQYLDPKLKYNEIAKIYREETPKYFCKNCIRETKFGKENIKYGFIGYKLAKGRCDYCHELLIKL
jgi:hypothetical protein